MPIENWVISETVYTSSTSPQMKSSIDKLADSSKMTDNSQLSFKPSFLIPSYVGNNPTVPSPTFPIGIRPPPPSPQTPTQHPFGSPYPHYMLPPNLYSYYHKQSTPSQPFSPTNQSQSSPISPFLVPNLSQSTSPSMISTSVNSNTCHLPSPNLANSTASIYEAFPQNTSIQSGKSTDHANSEVDKEVYSSHKSQSLLVKSHFIDLTLDRQTEDSPVDCSKSHSYKSDAKPPIESRNNLKRKSPIEENSADSFKASSTFGPDSVEHSLSNPTLGPVSRKHRILKPPNIDISSECDFRNGMGSAFLPSPLFAPQFVNQLPSSPYTYLEHIPLSAPPIAPSHHNASKFDFSGQSDAFFLISPHRHLSNKIVSTSNSSLQSVSAPAKSSNASTTKSEMPNSILKDSKRKSSINSEPKVTFQVPYTNTNKNVIENQENRYKEKESLLSSKSLKKKTNSLNGRKQSQKYPEYFRKGSTIKLGNGELKKVEELSTEDFIKSASTSGKLKVEQSEVLFISDKSKNGLVRISFLVGQSKVKVSLDCALEHPFFVVQKGWSSCSPSICSKRYGLNSHRLTKGDIVITLANKQENGLISQSFSSQRLSKSLTSSSSSLSSSTSMSSSSSSLTMNPTSNTIVYSSSNISGLKCPPPAHLNKSSYKSLLNSNDEAALNLEIKSKSKTYNQNYENRSTSHRSDEEEEIDVENVDDGDRARA